MSRYFDGSEYVFAWPMYHKGWYGYSKGLNLSDEEWSASRRFHSCIAPVNARYRRRVDRMVTWREILAANGYEEIVVSRIRRWFNRQSAYKKYGVRHDRKLGEMLYILCVFHQERSASLCLTPWGFFCFGCGAEGGLVDFVAGINHLKSAKSIKRYFADTFPQMQPRTK